MKQKMRKREPLLGGVVDSAGGLFDVPEDHPLRGDIGKHVRYYNKTCGIEHETFIILGLQNDYKGNVIYRGFVVGDEIGRPIPPSDVYFVEVPKVDVEIIESERGMGQKVDEVREFENMYFAMDFIKKYNAGNTLERTPDWYMYARLKEI